MRLLDPRLWLAGLTLCGVGVAVYLETRRTSPGPLSPVHARAPELEGAGGCDRCHGAWGETMADACAGCHEEIAEELRTARGFHGATKLDACGRCHVEHHGEAVPLSGAHAFALADVPDREGFDHGFTRFGLNGAHAGLACQRCHPRADEPLLEKGETRFLGKTQACASCHEDPHEGRLSSDCARCHGQEHPFKELANFVHPASFPLEGAHAGHACTDCHAKDSAWSVEALGGDGPKPEPRACEACHESPHDAGFLAGVAQRIGSTPAASCERCHPTMLTTFAVEPPALEPELHAAAGFALTGVHAVACERCHAPRASEPVFAVRYPGRAEADCAACHADPHGGQFAGSGAAAPACTACHESERWAPSTIDVAVHARSYPLDGAHARVACDACHAQTAGGPRTFTGTPRRCDACHRDPHAGQLDAFVATLASVPAEGACAACHGTASFADVGARFGVAEHGKATGFALVDAHARARCEACHAPSPTPDAFGRRFGRAAELFPQPVRECASCHADVHRGSFADTGCAQCHDEESFTALRQPFDHGNWTGFVLDGAHASAKCDTCHGQADRTRDGRTLGRVEDRFHGPPELCSTCHRDPHDGAFDHAGMPRFLGQAQGCARCHTTASWGEHARDAFDHGLFTRFVLEGRHAEVACEACHVPPREPAADRRLGRAAGTSCEACHQDPHGGQFAGGVVGCERCHDARSFQDLRFDHDRDSRFALDARHARLACAACHRPWPLADGRRVVRYKPLGTTCVECHGFSKEGGR